MLQAVAVEAPSIDAVYSGPEQAEASVAASIRKTAADLVRGNQLNEARLLLERSLSHYPDSQDLLAMLALVSEVRHEWPRAETALERLLEIQGDSVTAETYSHLVRVVRCQGKLEKALQLARQGVELNPDHALLNSELDTLSSMLTANQSSTKG